jgi:hypothetical protein
MQQVDQTTAQLQYDCQWNGRARCYYQTEERHCGNCEAKSCEPTEYRRTEDYRNNSPHCPNFKVCSTEKIF